MNAQQSAKELYDATKEYFKSKSDELEYENDIAILWWNDTLEELIVGKNEREREAVFYQLHEGEMITMMKLKKATLNTRGRLETAKVSHGAIKFQMNYDLEIDKVDIERRKLGMKESG